MSDYDREYREAAFYVWYKANRPGVIKTTSLLQETEDGRRPNWSTVEHWMNTDGWIERADALDAEVSMRLDKEAIKERAAQLKKMAKVGEEIMEKGKRHILDNDFDSSAAAVRAVGLGADMVFKYAASAYNLARISSMTPEQLEREARRLLGKEDVIDAGVEDVPTENSENIETDDADNQDNNE